MPESRQTPAQTETIREGFSRTPRSAGFPEERFDLRRLAAMPPALQCGERADHYFVGRGLGRSDTSRRKSRDVEFVVRTQDESRAESGGRRLPSGQPGLLQ